MYAVFSQIAAVIGNTNFVNHTLPNAIDFAYGQLKLSIVGSKEMTGEMVRLAVDRVRALVDSGVLSGFFEIYLECMRGVWMWIVFGIPLYIYLEMKDNAGGWIKEPKEA